MSAQTPAHPDTATVWAWLAEVPDPEIPVVSVVDLGIVRDVAWMGESLQVTITPTYSGCPATGVIGRDIERALRARGVAEPVVRQQLFPPWTTDWIGEAAKEKLRAYGIAPPAGSAAKPAKSVPCPHCGSANTVEVSRFGSTPCKAHWRCQDCLEPFDRFKCI